LSLQDETSITELTITPDGRIFVFGLSRQVLEMLEELDFTSPDLQRRLESLEPAAESAQAGRKARRKGDSPLFASQKLGQSPGTEEQ
jgi:hypothetical protein